jgi:hypothetical protein
LNNPQPVSKMADRSVIDTLENRPSSNYSQPIFEVVYRECGARTCAKLAVPEVNRIGGGIMFGQIVGASRILVAVLGMALALSVISPFTGAAVAKADGHQIVDPDATWGNPDGAQSRDQSIVPAVQSTILTKQSGPSAPANVWPKPLENMPTASYPASPSWPASGWGVAEG